MNSLIGIWKSDPNDKSTQDLYGNVMMNFQESGDLLYHIFLDEKEQIILMTYLVDNDSLITDQPSSPQREITKFQLSEDRLILYFEGGISVFIKVQSEESIT